jgi:two-component system, OmpR family, sensor histidine kinase KdpD
MAAELRRRTPEELLFELQAGERAARRGYLKIVLGYASGVGKSFRMLDEARRRRERGQDVVIGGIQPRMPPDVQALLAGLEVIPLKTVAGGSAIDVEALVRRRPAVCFIDGLAYDNPPGTKNPARWQDVQELLQAGIKVIGSVNIQYVEELREQVEAITGKHVTETVPMAFVRSADEIEIVDAPPEEPGDRQQRRSRLRELALVVAADVVDQQLVEYLERHGIEQHLGTRERILVCLTPRANAEAMIETARIIAGRFHAGLIAAYVRQERISPADRQALEDKLSMARAAGASIEMLEGEDPVGAILDCARSRGVTQLFIGHSQRSGLGPRLWGNPVEKLIQRSRGMDIRIFPQ